VTEQPSGSVKNSGRGGKKDWVPQRGERRKKVTHPRGDGGRNLLAQTKKKKREKKGKGGVSSAQGTRERVKIT